MAVALLALVLDTLWMKDAYFAGLSGAFRGDAALRI